MVTKGHHFPGVSLVAVINADQGLFSSDFRAAERLAQTIVQVAGRAGRGSRAGEVLIQTEYPGAPAAAEPAAGRLRRLRRRRAGRSAPLRAGRRLAAWRCCAPRARAPRQALDFLRARARAPARSRRARLLGPVPASMARRAGRHHAQLLIEHPERGGLHAFLDHWLPEVERLPESRRVRWALDVDPLDIQ